MLINLKWNWNRIFDKKKKRKKKSELPGYASKTFPATWSQISISFISVFIKNRSCFSDKEREAQFVHSWNVCLSFNTHVSSISSQLGNRKSAHILWNSPVALLECRLNQPFIYQQQSVFWRQLEFVTSHQSFGLWESLSHLHSPFFFWTVRRWRDTVCGVEIQVDL